MYVYGMDGWIEITQIAEQITQRVETTSMYVRTYFHVVLVYHVHTRTSGREELSIIPVTHTRLTRMYLHTYERSHGTRDPIKTF